MSFQRGFISIAVFNLLFVLVSSKVVEDDEVWSERKQSDRTSCSWDSVCTPLSSCGIISQIVDYGCLTTHRVNGLTCGYSNRGEIMVCCPSSCPAVEQNCGEGPRLIGSRLAFPWVGRVSFVNKDAGQKAQLCVGSIISRRVILTAAHCALAKTKSHKIQSVMVGGELCCDSKEAALSHVIVHPSYNPSTFSHNIALLVLKHPLNYTRSVQPLCLPEKNEIITYWSQRALLVGWGRLANQLEESRRQEMVELPLLPTRRCSILYGNKVNITDDMICAGGEGTDACSGFGGAPLVVTDPRKPGRYFQVGLISFGADKCGTIGVPSVFTKVASYITWIRANSPQDSGLTF